MSRFTLAILGQMFIVMPLVLVVSKFATDIQAIAFSLIQVLGMVIIAFLLDRDIKLK